MEKLGVLEAIGQTASIVDSYKEEILEDARIFSWKLSQTATPETISGYRKVIGTAKHFRDIKEAAEELDQELYSHNADEDRLFDSATFFEIYQYLYLKNGKKNPCKVYSGRGEAVRVSTSRVLSQIEESLNHWEKKDRTEGLGFSRKEGEVLWDMELLCMYFFPKEDIPEIEKKIENELENQNIDPDLLEALSNFPSQFNRRTAHRDSSTRLDFFYTYTHEFAHAYIEEKTPRNSLIFNEATSQFISAYLETAEFNENSIPSKTRLEGLKFENSPKNYSGYDDEYYPGASKEIYIITEFMKLKAMEKIRSLDLIKSQNFKIVEWLIKEEAGAVNKCKEEKNEVSKEGILRYYIPVELREEVKETNEIIENELNPLINEIKEFMEELENFKDFHYHEWVNKINEVLKNAVNQEMSESEFKNHLEQEAERQTKLHNIERILNKDLDRLQKISKKDSLELEEITKIVEELPEEPDPSKEMKKIKRRIRPGKTELEELKEDLKDLENLKSEIEELKKKDKKELSIIEHQGYQVDVKELEEEEIQSVNELISRLGKLEQECDIARKNLENIIKKS